MKGMLKSRLPLTVAAAIVGLGATTVPVTVNAQEVSRSNTGQALIFPYYTVNAGWITTLNVINTSDTTLAVKVRFHEQKNSRDVLDFNIVLSPYDSWTGWVKDSARGTQLFTVDKSCTSPLKVDGVNASSFAYTGTFDDTGGGGLNRLREGYVEMLVMGEAAAGAEDDETNLTAYNAKHVDGVPRDCTVVDEQFIATTTWTPAPAGSTTAADYVSPGSGTPPAEADFGPPSGNYLKGNVGWLNAATGVGAGSQAIAISDWSTKNFVTAQQFPWFLEPTFASGDDLWTVTGVLLFEGSVEATSTFNEWANNPVNGARTDWIVTFPTKAYHVDRFDTQIQAAVSRYRSAAGASVVTCTDPEDRTTCSGTDGPVPVTPFEEVFGQSVADDGTGVSAITVEWNIYDREENTEQFVSSGTSISPAPPPTVEIETLKYEANVVQFADSSVLGAAFPAILDASGALNGATSGWADLTFVGATPSDSTNGNPGLPVAAFAVRAIDRTVDAQAYNAGYVLCETCVQ